MEVGLSGPLAEGWRGTITKLRKVVLTGGPLIVAHGPGPARPPAPQDPAQRYRDARAAAGGWFLFSSFEPLATWTKNVRALLQPPTFVPLKAPAAAAGKLESLQSSSNPTDQSFSEVPVGPADGLPPGAIHIVHRVASNPAYARRPSHPALEGAYEHHLFLAGTEEITWFAVSESEGLARAKLTDASSGKSGGLGSRSDLARLRSLPAGGVGFVTPKAILALMADKETTADLEALDRSLLTLGMLGSSGTTPIFLSLAPSSAKGNSTVLRTSAEISKVGVRELIKWLQ